MVLLVFGDLESNVVDATAHRRVHVEETFHEGRPLLRLICIFADDSSVMHRTFSICKKTVYPPPSPRSLIVAPLSNRIQLFRVSDTTSLRGGLEIGVKMTRTALIDFFFHLTRIVLI